MGSQPNSYAFTFEFPNHTTDTNSELVDQSIELKLELEQVQSVYILLDLPPDSCVVCIYLVFVLIWNALVQLQKFAT